MCSGVRDQVDAEAAIVGSSRGCSSGNSAAAEGKNGLVLRSMRAQLFRRDKQLPVVMVAAGMVWGARSKPQLAQRLLTNKRQGMNGDQDGLKMSAARSAPDAPSSERLRAPCQEGNV